MKAQSITLAVSGLLCSFATSVMAQDGSESTLWASIAHPEQLKLEITENGLTSTNPEVQELITEHNIQSIRQALPASRLEVLQNVYELACTCDQHAFLADVARMNHLFEAPELGPEYTPLYEPNDYSIVYTEDYALDLINAQAAWDITHGDSSIIIAVSDQNFYINHEELVGKIHYYDTTNTSPQTHGTAVAITAAGNTDNVTGKSSIGFNSELALYRMSFNDILTATYSGSRVINVSWSSGCYPSSYIQMVMDEAYANGSVVVCAAGNGGTCGGPTNLVYPAACNNVISVTSIGPNDNHERYIGDTTSTHQHNSTVDIAVPGYDIALSTAPGYYITGNGTSFAAPILSGTIALMLSVDSCLTVDDIEYILYATSVNIDAQNPAYVGMLGSGRLDAGAAVAMASTYNACGITDPDPEPDPDPVGGGEGEGGEDGDPDFPGQNETSSKDQAQVNSTDEGSSVGVAEVLTTQTRIYPNPVKSGATVRIESELEIQSCVVYSLNGTLVISEQQLSNNTLNLETVSRGTYLLHVQFTNGEKIIKRLVVQ